MAPISLPAACSGDIISYLLLKSLARPGAYIIVIALGIISLIISTNISLIQIFMWFWDNALNAYDRVKTEKIIKEEQEKRWKEEGLSARRVYLMIRSCQRLQRQRRL